MKILEVDFLNTEGGELLYRQMLKSDWNQRPADEPFWLGKFLNLLESVSNVQLRLSMMSIRLVKYFSHRDAYTLFLKLLSLLNPTTHQCSQVQHSQQGHHILQAVKRRKKQHYIFQTTQLRQQANPSPQQGLDKQKKGSSDRAPLSQHPLLEE